MVVGCVAMLLFCESLYGVTNICVLLGYLRWMSQLNWAKLRQTLLYCKFCFFQMYISLLVLRVVFRGSACLFRTLLRVVFGGFQLASFGACSRLHPTTALEVHKGTHHFLGLFWKHFA